MSKLYCGNDDYTAAQARACVDFCGWRGGRKSAGDVERDAFVGGLPWLVLWVVCGGAWFYWNAVVSYRRQ